MKNYKYIVTLLAICFGFTLFCPVIAQADSKLVKTTRIPSPPAGKVLVNFHRPSGYGGGRKFSIFDGNGTMLMDLPGQSEYQLVCDPGQQIFISVAEFVSVVKADLAADKTYDLMVDVGTGFFVPNPHLIPLNKGDARRKELADFEKREKRIWTLERNKYVTDYEAKNKKQVEDVKRDFIGGAKSDRAAIMNKDDCR